MNEMTPAVPTETSSYETTRFNALRHGLLSRYTVLPWEDEAEYQALVGALVMEHAPSGPTEEHLVEELAGSGTGALASFVDLEYIGRAYCGPDLLAVGIAGDGHVTLGAAGRDPYVMAAHLRIGKCLAF